MRLSINVEDFQEIVVDLLGIDDYTNEALEIIYDNLGDNVSLDELEYYLENNYIMEDRYMTEVEFEQFYGKPIESVYDLQGGCLLVMHN